MAGSATTTTCPIASSDDPLSCELTPLVAGTAYKIVVKARVDAEETDLAACESVGNLT